MVCKCPHCGSKDEYEKTASGIDGCTNCEKSFDVVEHEVYGTRDIDLVTKFMIAALPALISENANRNDYGNFDWAAVSGQAMECGIEMIRVVRAIEATLT